MAYKEQNLTRFWCSRKKHIQANRDTLVHLDCPINFMYDALQLDEIDGPPLTFPSLRTARLSDTPVNNQEGGRVLLEFLVLAPQLQEVQYTPDQSINHAPSIGDAILRISPVRRVIFKFHVGDRGLNLLGDLADTIATRGLAYHVERLQVPVLCYHADPARKANGEPWEQVVKSGHVARVKCLNVTIDCVNGNSCHTRASMSIIQRFCQNLVDVGANMTLEELALPPIHPSDFDICRRMMEGTCVVLRRFTFSSKA
ncbi:hypothetical protein BCR43DRAFT_504405 [Syncephalastrum racemosum]|uniref:Uncharacterized protein n=1 Tax=Syncephalastrum racemosum TaxID=13706 RepID=A0A1X2HEU0_SYNRA|nr:hypothetical protein BCR43DRAFT_504405 [Syncephalastrum racemosum]